MIEFRGVRKVYRAGVIETVVLQDCSFTVAAGRFAAVLGVSGSGKTSLLNLIGGLDVPSGGEVFVASQALSGASRRELTAFRRRSVGFVFQFYNLLPTLTALENVEVGIELLGLGARVTRRRAAEYLDLVGLGEHGHRFPSQLSGGQQQRVAIARALAKQPSLLLADEPTGNLDAAAAEEVIARMRTLQRETGTTLVVVTHNPSIADVADTVLHIVDGRTRQSMPNAGRTGAPSPAAHGSAPPPCHGPAGVG